MFLFQLDLVPWMRAATRYRRRLAVTPRVARQGEPLQAVMRRVALRHAPGGCGMLAARRLWAAQQQAVSPSGGVVRTTA
ncbi:hypothetical protein [Paludibacterium sp.]|uniref:hypothetical protein n=1 Tax=Paludibacterium sp. TaxID=1917523 RepID=UPI0025F54793|nr:hypothetical protein [Paludibacterium sp.]MBV8647428.1 hypothetical protein [Paludibacterium sp.]